MFGNATKKYKIKIFTSETIAIRNTIFTFLKCKTLASAQQIIHNSPLVIFFTVSLFYTVIKVQVHVYP